VTADLGGEGGVERGSGARDHRQAGIGETSVVAAASILTAADVSTRLIARRLGTDPRSVGDESLPDPGTPGASAWRAHERHRRDVSRRRAVLAMLLGPSPAEKRRRAEARAWAVGARGEEWLASWIARHCPGVPVLHDRKLGRRGANIDHLAVAASGVHVIDAKRLRGKVEVRKPLFGQATLRIAGRDRTKLISGLKGQVEAVIAAVAAFDPDAPVHGCLCFVPPEGVLADSGIPMMRTLTVDGYPLLSPRKLGKRLQSPGPLTPQRIERLVVHLAERFPSA
jgi:hypothetical protein